MHKLNMYSPLRAWKKGDYPISPFVHLSVGYHTVSDEHILLSPQLMCDQEIDDIVDKLSHELEEFRKAAKRELKMLHKKILQK